MPKIAFAGAISVVAVAAWLGGVWYSQETERSQFDNLCKNFARIRVINPSTGEQSINQPQSCIMKRDGTRCEDRSTNFSKIVDGAALQHALPASFTIDPYKYGLNIGIDYAIYTDRNSNIVSVLDFSVRPSGINKWLTGSIIDDRNLLHCSDFEV